MAAAVPTKLREVATAIHADGKARSETVRTLLSWFAAQRRGYWVVAQIQSALRDVNLETSPNFEYVHIDTTITLQPVALAVSPVATVPQAGGAGAAVTSDATGREATALPDPVPRIGLFASANRRPMSVARTTTVAEAATIMMMHDFSQLPVMNGERSVDGAISWRSIGRRRSLGHDCTLVADCMEPVEIFAVDEPLFALINVITAKDYVLVRDKERRIVGIVTTSDLSVQFRQMSEPFLLLREIENHLRRLLNGSIPLDVLRSARSPSDTGRSVESVADLTFGEYVRIVENPDNWKRLDLPLDRAAFVRELKLVHDVRNDVMHFDPDTETDERLNVTLSKFVHFLRYL